MNLGKDLKTAAQIIGSIYQMNSIGNSQKIKNVKVDY